MASFKWYRLSSTRAGGREESLSSAQVTTRVDKKYGKKWRYCTEESCLGFHIFYKLFLLRVQLSRQLLQVRRRDDAVIGDERLDDEEAPFIFSSFLLLPVFVIDKLSNGV